MGALLRFGVKTQSKSKTNGTSNATCGGGLARGNW